jgi:two-component system sensor histidine kinase/response regulator
MKLILLIDDDENICQTFGLALRLEGYRVIESNSGLAGLELARQQLPDLILTDINMPGGNGMTLLSHIRADPELGSKQVVLMTGRPDLVSSRNGMEQGADDFLVKPITTEALLKCMKARLDRSDVNWRVEDRFFSRFQSCAMSTLPHECFTPLAGIIGLAEILESEQISSPEEIRSLSRDILQSAMRLHRTLRNYLLILDFQTENKEHLQDAVLLTPVDVRKSIDLGIAAALESQKREKDLTVECEECSILVPSADLVLIVEELLDNAFKFSRSGSPVKLRLNREGSLLVTDSGRGMTQEEINQVAAFKQFDRKKHEQQGLGLGLTLVKAISKRIGAEFTIENRFTEGITQAKVDFSLG